MTTIRLSHASLAFEQYELLRIVPKKRKQKKQSGNLLSRKLRRRYDDRSVLQLRYETIHLVLFLLFLLLKKKLQVPTCCKLFLSITCLFCTSVWNSFDANILKFIYPNFKICLWIYIQVSAMPSKFRCYFGCLVANEKFLVSKITELTRFLWIYSNFSLFFPCLYGEFRRNFDVIP